MDWAFSLMIVCLFLIHEWIFGRVMFYVHPFISYPKYTLLPDISFLYKVYTGLILDWTGLIYKFPILRYDSLDKSIYKRKFQNKTK